MVEKRVFDTILATFMRNLPSIRIIALIDREGLPISFAIKSRKFKIKPDTLGSLIKQANYPIENYAKNLNIQWPLVQIYILEDGCLMVINLGLTLIGILFDPAGWPLEASQFQDLLTKLAAQLGKGSGQEEGLLAKITGDQNKKDALESVASDKINQIMKILYSLNEGKLDPSLSTDSAPAPEIFTKVGMKYDSFIVDQTGSILSLNPNYGPEFVMCTKETLDIQLGGVTQFQSGKTLCSLSYFFNGVLIINGILGSYNKQNIFMFKQYPDWSKGFNTIMSPFHSLANFFVADYASNESMNFIDKIIYLTDSIDSLKDRINSYVKSKDFTTARTFMERAAILSARQKNFVGAGDLYRWMAFTNTKDGDTQSAITQYEDAAKMHILGGDFEKSAGDYKDIAAVYANQQKVSDAIENYMFAEEEAKKSNKKELLVEISGLKKNLLSGYLTKVADFVKQSTGETLTISYISQKFDLKDNVTITILNQLLEQNVISGEVDADRGRYTKQKLMAKKAETSSISPVKAPGFGTSSVSGSAIGLDYSKIQPELNSIESKLRSIEKDFESINLPFLKYLEYENLLNTRTFIDVKLRVKENQSVIQTQNLCPICFKPINPEDQLSECASAHKMHQTCVALWVKTQDACPICDSALFPHILKTTFLGVKGSTGGKDENMSMINQMQQQLADLKKQVAHLEEVSASLKQMKGDEKDLVEKITKERELKDKMEQELKKKDLTIRELKSMIKLFKR